jgi:hypothetical protein
VRSFSVILQLPPGRYQYKFIVNDVWFVDPHQTVVKTEAGVGELNGSGDTVLVVKLSLRYICREQRGGDSRRQA